MDEQEVSSRQLNEYEYYDNIQDIKTTLKNISFQLERLISITEGEKQFIGMTPHTRASASEWKTIP